MAGENLTKIGEKAVKMALSLGASSAEVFLSRAKDLTIEVSEQQVETMKLAEQQGLGIRILQNQRLGFSYSSAWSDSALDQLVSQAIENSRSTGEDKYNILPGPAEKYPEVALWDADTIQAPVEEKIDLAKNIEQAARKYDHRIKITERCAYSDSSYEVAVVNSLGVAGQFQGSYCGASAFVVAEDQGESQTGFSFQYQLKYQEIDPVFLGQEAAKKGVRMLGAKNIKTQEMTAVFDPYVATNFLGSISHALSAESVQKGKSRLAGKMNTRVASGLVTLIDDGAKEKGIMSSPFDGEGVPSQKTVLIDQGVLKGFLYNTYAAAKDGVKSTGNGIRGSYKGTPEIGTTNFYIEKGAVSQEDLLKKVTKGIYLTEVMGMHTANPISGDFSLGAAGLLIEHGELTQPVRGIAIAGNFFDLLSAIDAVGSDLTFFIGKGSPTLRIAKMTVSGS
ncbi:TldD/PmbA family protein [Candidatus Formimonas warabiya]|nr:TldD/PmbA family protein [Candidatus Formimonas warabiya]